MGEFAANANVSAINKILLFLAMKRYNPRISFDHVNLSANSTHKRIANAKTRLIASHIKKVWNFTWTEMAKSQKAQAMAANQYRKKSPKYKIGDKIWLSIKNIKTEWLSKKLDYKQIGIFKVQEPVRSSYKLDLPSSTKIYNMFYLNLLRSVATNPLPD